jgi:hypothetical protein
MGVPIDVCKTQATAMWNLKLNRALRERYTRELAETFSSNKLFDPPKRGLA